MNHVLEPRYRRLLRAYPKDYRAEHGEELIGTLMEAARPGARWPSFREALHLLAGGFTVRVRAARAAGVPPWADGLHLGALIVAVVTFAGFPVLPHLVFPVWTALGIVLMVALVRSGGCRGARLPLLERAHRSRRGGPARRPSGARQGMTGRPPANPTRTSCAPAGGCVTGSRPGGCHFGALAERAGTQSASELPARLRARSSSSPGNGVVLAEP